MTKVVIQKGFTIIETMLFLAITGALTVMVLAGSGLAISQQRYKDAASRTQNIVQEQYANTINTLNSREGDNWRCDPASGQVRNTGEGGVSASWRGASECEVVGRFLQFSEGGRKIVTGNVTGYRFVATPEPTNDLQAFSQYRLARLTSASEERAVAWGASVTTPGNGQAIDNQLILVLRSPYSGTLRTFASSSYHPPSGAAEIPSSVVTDFNKRTVFCINPEGFSIGEKLGVVIAEGAGGSSAVTQQASGSGC